VKKVFHCISPVNGRIVGRVRALTDNKEEHIFATITDEDDIYLHCAGERYARVYFYGWTKPEVKEFLLRKVDGYERSI
jgi:hypothetical protein